MDDRLTTVIADLRERFSSDAVPAEVEAYLAAEGFDRRQIGEILSLMFPDRLVSAHGDRTDVSASMNIRILGPHERGRFAPDAWGHLLSLSGAGMLNAAELEYVIERAMTQIDGRIALDDLRAFLEGSGFDEGGAGDPPTLH